jgi:hypothetical protein
VRSELGGTTATGLAETTVAEAAARGARERALAAGEGPEGDQPIWQYRAGAIPKVRRRRSQGRQLARRSATATARRGGLAAWKKRSGGWGMEIGPGRPRLTPGQTAGEGSGERKMSGGRRLRREEDERRAKAPERRRGRGVFGNLGLGRSGSGLGMDSVFLFTF